MWLIENWDVVCAVAVIVAALALSPGAYPGDSTALDAVLSWVEGPEGDEFSVDHDASRQLRAVLLSLACLGVSVACLAAIILWGPSAASGAGVAPPASTSPSLPSGSSAPRR